MRLNPDTQPWGDDAWLALATYPDGRRAVIVAPEGHYRPLLTRTEAERLARGIDWHPSCHGVGEVVPVRYATNLGDVDEDGPPPGDLRLEEPPFDRRLRNVLVLDVPDLHWQRRSLQGDLSRYTSVEVNGVFFQLVAWPVRSGVDAQSLDGASPEDLDLLDAIVAGEGPFATMRIEGREHVVVMFPYRA